MARTLLLVAVLLGAGAARAQNLLSNGDFANDISGWENASGYSWSTEDRNADLQSGSVEIPISSSPSVFVQMWSCFSAAEGVEYAYRASFFIRPGGTVGVLADVWVQWYDAATCNAG